MTTDRIESVILQALLYDEPNTRRILPFLEDKYFQDKSERLIFTTTRDFIHKYNALPTKAAIAIALSDMKGLADDEYKVALQQLDQYEADRTQKPNDNWLIDQAEAFCKDRAVCNAVIEAVRIVNGENDKLEKGAIPELLTKALAVSFDPHIGHDYFEDADARFEFYRRVEERIPFDLEFFNKVTRGGLPNKTLNIILAGTGVGKTLAMCHFASSYLKMGKNVLYISMEMSQERISERIDANLLDIPLNQISEIPKGAFQQKMKHLRSITTGKLIVKGYPTASAHAGHFRALLNDLRLKKNFAPQVIFIDYLGICASSRIKQGPNVNSYTFIKAIAEELRGLADEFNVPLISAAQTTRGGFDNSDVGLTDTAESFGLPHTADFLFALINTEELVKLGQLLVKILKSRYNDSALNQRFVIGVDKSKMRLYDVEQSAQNDLIAEPPTTTNIVTGRSNPPAAGGQSSQFNKFRNINVRT